MELEAALGTEMTNKILPYRLEDLPPQTFIVNQDEIPEELRHASKHIPTDTHSDTHSSGSVNWDSVHASG
jgi:hypothetical protein